MTHARIPGIRRLGAVTLITALCLLLLPGTALAAGNARRDGSQLIYDGGSEANSLTLSWDGSKYSFYDSALSAVGAGSGCVASAGSFWGSVPEATCSGTGITSILIRTAGGSDTAQVELANRLPAGLRLVVVLGDGADSWDGSQYTPDTVYGGSGNDAIKTRGGNDWVDGGGGRDTIYGEEGADRLNGGAGPDFLYGEAGNDRVNGDAGNDEVWGSTGADTVNGGYGHDYVSGGLSRDMIYGGAGDDRLLDDHRGSARSFLSPDVLNGGYGVDAVDYYYRRGEATQLRLSLDGRANDGKSGEGDQILGSVENIIGGRYSDVIIGSRAANSLAGREGNDLMLGYGGNDKVYGEAGSDRLEGGPGADVLEGWYGADTLVGGTGADALWGGVDGDLLYARDGVRDAVNCGGGADRASVDGRDAVSTLCDRVARS